MEPNPLVRCPNKNILLCDGRRRSYDDLTQAQFVGGVLSTIQDVNLSLYKNAMINELKETMHLSNICSWPIAKSAFADIMTKIGQGRISWDDPDSLWRTRMDGKSDAYMGQNRRAT